MSNKYRPNRKASDEDIIKMNSVGLSLKTIADALGCHQSTITIRLKSLGIAPADTRRCFMEDVFLRLTEPQQNWVADQLGAHYSIKDYVTNLVAQDYIRKNQPRNP